ncbi:MAG: TIR domain-containing protein [Lyngbya sp. HA4199-MV5]|jgi:WD40 repeat protein|nr:TIR domain-containing protein [Lyngbya sp. HA4199-MV5]
MSDVFISYSRKDKAFVQTLHTALQAHHRDTWIDWEDIPLTADWWLEIQRGIEAANAFVFVISPDSVVSTVCREEVDHAVEHHKRLVPIVRREGFNPQQIHPALSKHNWLFFREQDSFEQALQSLLKAIDTDLDYVRAHTRLLERAIEWKQQGQNDSYLLRGSDLETAQQWLVQSYAKAPEPTALQRAYLDASHQAETLRQRAEIKRQRLALISGAVGLAVVAGLAVKTFQESTVATLREKAAESKNLLSTQPVGGLMLALQATGLNLSRQIFTGQVLDPVQSSLFSAIALNQEKAVLLGHTNVVNAVAVSPNGQFIVSGSDDQTLRLWTLEGQPIGEPLTGHTGAVTAVAISPNSQYVLSGSTDGTLRLWDVQRRASSPPFQGHRGDVLTVAFSPDGQTIASGGKDQTVRLWNLQGTPIGQPFNRHKAPIMTVAFSPDGQTIASGSEASALLLSDLKGNAVGQPFRGHTRAITAVAFSPNGQTIITGSKDKTIRRWNRQGVALGDPFQSGQNIVTSLAVSADGRTIISGDHDNAVRQWRWQGKPIGGPLRGHTAWVTSVALSPDGRTIVSGANDNTVRLWHPRNYTAEDVFLSKSTALYRRAEVVAFDQQAQTKLSISEDGLLRIWKAPGKPFTQIPLQGYQEAVSLATAVAKDQYGPLVIPAAISPNGQSIAVGGTDQTIQLWNLQGQAIGRPFQGLTAAATSLSFSPDGQSLVSGSNDGTIRRWNLQGQLLGSPLQGHTGAVTAIAVSPNGQFIASGSRDRTLRLWDQAGKPVGEPFQHQEEIRAVLFTPDSRSVVSGSNDGTIRRWSLQGQPLTQPFRGHSSWVTALAISPDGQLIASGSWDKTVRLWNPQGHPLGEVLQGHEDFITTIAFSPDGRSLLTGSADSNLRLWHVGNWAEWLTAACEQMKAVANDPVYLPPDVKKDATRTCQGYASQSP